jgi:hypothetical protein
MGLKGRRYQMGISEKNASPLKQCKPDEKNCMRVQEATVKVAARLSISTPITSTTSGVVVVVDATAWIVPKPSVQILGWRMGLFDQVATPWLTRR